MGLIQAGIGAVGSTMADQWKEFFYCESMDSDVLVLKGRKRTSGRSSNKGNDNIITTGSGIAVADGQCALVVEQGQIVEVCATPGEYTYDRSTEPSLFSGDLGEGIKKTFETIGRRFTYGGDTGKDQRIYYINTKELMDNKFGTANPIIFRVVDRNIGLDLDTGVRCNGVYSYRITDPLLFYSNVCANVEDAFYRSELDTQLKTEFISALQPAFAKLSDLEIRPSSIPAHAEDLCRAMNEQLTDKWSYRRGISVVSVAMNPITIPEEDAKMIKEAQRMAMLKDANMGAASVTQAYSEAMKAAASNPNGAMMGFMGMNMASQAVGGAMNPQNLYEMGAQQQAQQEAAKKAEEEAAARRAAEEELARMKAEQAAAQQAPPKVQPAGGAGSWTCSCGAVNTGKFCMDCGSPKPAPAVDGWTCSCGTVNKGKFCMECGSPKPAGAPLYRCDKCGWEPEDPSNPPKFCPECGDVFDDKDIQ